MIIKSSRKTSGNIAIKLQSMEGRIVLSVKERKDHLKYLGVMTDESLTWKYHISYICSRVSRNIGIVSKLRHYLSIHQFKQIY